MINFKNISLKFNDKIILNNFNLIVNAGEKILISGVSGKGKTTFLKRMKKVVVGDRKLEGHTENAYEKLKNINKELAQLCRIHHDKSDDSKMKEFQKLDDK